MYQTPVVMPSWLTEPWLVTQRSKLGNKLGVTGTLPEHCEDRSALFSTEDRLVLREKVCHVLTQWTQRFFIQEGHQHLQGVPASVGSGMIDCVCLWLWRQQQGMPISGLHNTSIELDIWTFCPKPLKLRGWKLKLLYVTLAGLIPVLPSLAVCVWLWWSWRICSFSSWADSSAAAYTSSPLLRPLTSAALMAATSRAPQALRI